MNESGNYFRKILGIFSDNIFQQNSVYTCNGIPIVDDFFFFLSQKSCILIISNKEISNGPLDVTQ